MTCGRRHRFVYRLRRNGAGVSVTQGAPFGELRATQGFGVEPRCGSILSPRARLAIRLAAASLPHKARLGDTETGRQGPDHAVAGNR